MDKLAKAEIEAMARAIWDDSFDRMPDPPWEKTTALQKAFNRMLAESAHTAAARVREEAGYCVVPKEPSEEQVSIGVSAIDDYYDGTKDAPFEGSVAHVYRAMTQDRTTDHG